MVNGRKSYLIMKTAELVCRIASGIGTQGHKETLQNPEEIKLIGFGARRRRLLTDAIFEEDQV